MLNTHSPAWATLLLTAALALATPALAEVTDVAVVPGSSSYEKCGSTSGGETCYRRDTVAVDALTSPADARVAVVDEASQGNHREPQANRWWENATTLQVTVTAENGGSSVGAQQSVTVYRYHSEQPDSDAAINRFAVESGTAVLRNNQPAGTVTRANELTCASREQYVRCTLITMAGTVEREVYCIDPFRTDGALGEPTVSCIVREYSRGSSLPLVLLP
ncbi:MAG TPA: hypothetical protein VNZ52_04805 [Candidatus Thermoplasmatota archaeon]|nr:hypothetical protein [Candidatus Thermoplasmatota archaeon]